MAEHPAAAPVSTVHPQRGQPQLLLLLLLLAALLLAPGRGPRAGQTNNAHAPRVLVPVPVPVHEGELLASPLPDQTIGSGRPGSGQETAVRVAE